MRRHAMTLIEILVSVMILSIISMAMIGILLTSGELFRRGEYGKSATDEAVTVMARLEDDLARMVPLGDGGFLFIEDEPVSIPVPVGKYRPTDRHLDGGGSCLLAFVTAAADASVVRSDGHGARRLVAWWVERPTNPDAAPILWRAEASAEMNEDAATTSDPPWLEKLLSRAYDPAPPLTPDETITVSQVTTGVVHLGATLTSTKYPRDHETWITTKPSPRYDSSIAGIDPPIDTLDAIRVSLTMTGGGRFAQHGTLVTPMGVTDMKLRVAGVGPLSTLPHSALRIDPPPGSNTPPEWIEYSAVDGALITVAPPNGRGCRYSQASPHPAGSTVTVAPTWALVRAIPR